MPLPPAGAGVDTAPPRISLGSLRRRYPCPLSQRRSEDIVGRAVGPGVDGAVALGDHQATARPITTARSFHSRRYKAPRLLGARSTLDVDGCPGQAQHLWSGWTRSGFGPILGRIEPSRSIWSLAKRDVPGMQRRARAQSRDDEMAPSWGSRLKSRIRNSYKVQRLREFLSQTREFLSQTVEMAHSSIHPPRQRAPPPRSKEDRVRNGRADRALPLYRKLLEKGYGQ